MNSVKIKEGVYYIGVLDPDLRTFDIIMKTGYGSSYNSYLVKGEKAAIIETAKTSFAGDFLDKLQAILPLEEVEYVILNHTEPDHSGSLKYLLERAPHLKVVTSRVGNQYIRNIVNRDFQAYIVKDGDELDLGGKKLKFIYAQFLHWPDTMFTYLAEDKILFPCDAFGAHYCEPGIYNSEVEDRKGYDAAFRQYYDAIMSPFRDYVSLAVDKIKDLSIEVIAPSHGPVLIENPMDQVELYKQWSRAPEENNPPKVLVMYVSAYGCTSRLAEHIAKGLKDGGVDSDVVNVEKKDPLHIKEKMESADGLLFGSPTINRDAVKPIWDVLSAVDAIKNRGKPCAAFGSYGWGGEAVRLMEERLKGLKLDVMEPGLRAVFVPSEEELSHAYQFGADFARKVLSKRQRGPK